MLAAGRLALAAGAESKPTRGPLTSLHGRSSLLPFRLIICCDIVNFAELSTHSDTADCILLLNSIYSTFDTLLDKYRVAKVGAAGEEEGAGTGGRGGGEGGGGRG